MSEVSAYSTKMLQQFEYEDSESPLSIELRVRDEIQKNSPKN